MLRRNSQHEKNCVCSGSSNWSKSVMTSCAERRPWLIGSVTVWVAPPGKGRPMDRSGMRAATNTVWKEQVLVPKVLHRGPGRPCPFEGRKQHSQGVLNLGIGIKMDGLIFHIHQPDWQLELERCSLRLIENPSSETGTQNVEFCFAHRAFHSQQ